MYKKTPLLMIMTISGIKADHDEVLRDCSMPCNKHILPLMPCWYKI